MLCPEHIAAVAGEITIFGILFTLTVLVAVLEQPLAAVPVTV